MADISSKGQKASKMVQIGAKPSKQAPPKVCTIEKGKARDGMAARITGSSTGKVQ